jgi:hypothetical protein
MGEIEVFSTGTTVALLPDRPADAVIDTPSHTTPSHTTPSHPSFGDRIRHGGELVWDGFEHARDFHARPGHRPGTPPVPIGATSARAGGDTDIVRPVLISPVLACDLALSGRLFAQPIPHLSIARRDDESEQRFLVWEGQLDSAGRRRAVSLHLLASPSMIVTLLELVPSRPLRHHRERFVADGVTAVEVIARRLERAAASVAGATGP